MFLIPEGEVTVVFKPVRWKQWEIPGSSHAVSTCQEKRNLIQVSVSEEVSLLGCTQSGKKRKLHREVCPPDVLMYA